jgi:hypothetical protein
MAHLAAAAAAAAEKAEGSRHTPLIWQVCHYSQAEGALVADVCSAMQAN